MDVDALLADLDPDQRRAVTSESQLVAVIAGAGSGKTRVLTRRVAYRALTGTADGAHTVVLTFTREAAGELRRRLPRLGLNERITAGTFHSVAHQLLRQRWADRDRTPRSILNDRRRLVRETMGDENIDALVDEMNWATARGLGPAAYESAVRRGERRAAVDADRVATALEAYRAVKRRRGVVDLDDLLTSLIDEMAGDDEYADAIRWRFRHVLVDEAQDLNPLQHRIVDALRTGRDDLFLVGDPSQAIYGFTGSDPSLLLDVHDRFPGIEIVRLPVNHRCTPQIVAAGGHALEAGAQGATIESARTDGTAVTTRSHDDEAAEAAWVAQQVARLDPGLLRDGRVGVLARTHAVLAATRQALGAAGVPIRRSVDAAGSPIAVVLREAGAASDATRMRQWAQDQLELVEGGLSDDHPRAEVARVALEFLREQPAGDGGAFRSWLNTHDPFGGDAPGVELLTFHGAKGREWHSVFLLGCETSLVPHRSAVTVAAKAEEARLLYVALTRATDVLVVNWARRRAGYQRRFTPLLDGFASEAPPDAPPPRELLATSRDPRQVALERLRDWRAAAARSGGMLPEEVCSDHTLSVIATERPASPDELDRLTGMGAITASRLFDGIAVALSGRSAEPAQVARSTITGA